MTNLPAGSYRVDIRIEWATGEVGEFDTFVTHLGDDTEDGMIAAAMAKLVAKRGHEFPPSPYTWSGRIR